MRFLFTLACVACLASCARSPDADERAHDIERRLFAPCCWRQTLADHDSPIATALRDEISHRTHTGEASASIEDDLARRYGDAIRAMPRDWDPRAVLGATIAALVALALAALLWLTRRRPAATSTAPAAASEDARYGELLDDELLASD